MKTKSEILKLWKRVNNRYNILTEKKGVPFRGKERILEQYAVELSAYEEILEMNEKQIKKVLKIE